MRSAMARPMPARRAGDDGDFSLHIEQGHVSLQMFVVFVLSVIPGRCEASNRNDELS